MYSKFAKWYDLHYCSLKDYEAEAERIDYILGKFDPKPRSVLDVACGTGEHASILAKKYGYEVDGIDLEPDLIEIASAKCPKGEFTVADMRSFSLSKQYDVALCLFSSIAYSETSEGLLATLTQIGKHLKTGGWLIIEPWVEPADWKTGIVDASESFDKDTQTKVLQAREGRSERRVSVLNIDYHIESPEGDFHFTETHRLGLFTRRQIEKAMKETGFQPKYVPKGVLEAPLYLGCYLP